MRNVSTGDILKYSLFKKFLRHIWFEIYNRSKLVRNIKFLSKKIIPNFVFNKLRERIDKLLEFPGLLALKQ